MQEDFKKAGKNISDIKKWTEKIGIKSRRIVNKNIFSNDLALASARKILKNIDKVALITGEKKLFLPMLNTSYAQ